METSVIDLLVPTDIQVDDIDGNTSKITLRASRKRFWSYARQCIKKNSSFLYAWCCYNRRNNRGYLT